MFNSKHKSPHGVILDSKDNRMDMDYQYRYIFKYPSPADYQDVKKIIKLKTYNGSAAIGKAERTCQFDIQAK